MQKSDTLTPWPVESSVEKPHWADNPLVWIGLAILAVLVLTFMYFVLHMPVDAYLIRFWHIITWNFDK